MNQLKDFIDIYSKLIIGVISFIAPMTSYLLSTYITDRKKITDKLIEQEKNLDNILDKDFNEAKNSQQKAREFIEQSQNKLKNQEQEIKRKIKLLNSLNPKKCIIKLFVLLATSMAFLLIDVLIRNNVFNLYNHRASSLLFSVSIILFIWAISFLIQIALRLVEARQLLESEQREIKSETELINVEQEK